MDDNRERAAELVARLVAQGHCVRSDIEVRFDGQSAREALAMTAFDLFVLDIVLPHRFDEEPLEATAVSLLAELTETQRLKKPRHIIGLTAYAAAEHAVAPDFINKSWVVVRQDPMNDDWIHTIENAVAYISSNENFDGVAEHLVDVVVVTALQSEMDAVRKLPWNWQADEVLDDSQFYARGSFSSLDSERVVISAVAGRMGMVAAAVLVSKLVKKFRPRLVVMPGICAGVREKVCLGDVVFSEASWDYQSGKHVMVRNAIPKFQMDPHFISADSFVTARIDKLSRDEELSLSIWRGWEPRGKYPPKLVRGPVASGSAVIADGEITESIRQQQRKLIGIEMELYGVFYACEQAHRPKPLALGLKGICDFADDEKNDSAQAYAAYASASFMRAFCERYVAEL